LFNFYEEIECMNLWNGPAADAFIVKGPSAIAPSIDVYHGPAAGAPQPKISQNFYLILKQKIPFN
jgi:hypothetical protein